MANAIKYNLSAETLALKKGNFWIGTGDVGKGPTSSTGFYNGLEPPSGGFTIYLNKASGGPSIYTVSNEAQLTALTNSISVSTNLIKNNNGGNFANGTLAPFNGSYGTLPTVVDISNDRPYNGSISTKAAKFVTGGGMSIYSDPSPFTMTAGVTYTFSFWYKLANSNQTDIYFQNQGGLGDMNGNFLASSSSFAKPTQTWQRCSWTFTNVVNKIYFIIALNNSSAGSELLTTEFTLTEGSMPGGPGLTTSGNCLNWFATQTDKMVFNRDYPPIVTSGLTLNLDAGFSPSFATIPSNANSSTVTPWYDLSGNNNGTLINGPTYSSTNGGAIVFDGIDDYITIPDSLAPTPAVTMIFWINKSFTNYYLSIHSRNNNAVNGSHTGIGYGTPISSSGWIQIGYMGDGTNNYFIINGTIYSGNGGSQFPYDSVNSIVMFSMNNNGYFAGNNAPVTSLALTTSLGGYSGYQWLNRNYKTLGILSTSGNRRPFNGQMSNSLFYNRILSASEVSQNYYSILNSRMIVTNGLVLNLQAGNLNSYPSGGTMWKDVSGYGNDFTMVNGPTFNSNNSGYFQFDGADDYAYLAVNSSISVGTACSLEMVVKNDYAMRMGQGGSYWAYGFEGAGFSHTCGGNGNISPYFMGSEFHHYVFTWNQAQNNHSMYRDGVLVYSFTPTCGFNAGGGGFFVLGGARGNNGFQSYGSPHIAQLRLYGKILTNSEVEQNFNLMKGQYRL
jgi:hypothetical protein